MNFSNSQEKQLENLLAIRCSNINEANKLMKLVKSRCADRSLDIDKVSGELIGAIQFTDNITNYSAFISGVIRKLDPVVFAKRNKTPSFLSFHQALYVHMFEGEIWEVYLLDNIEETCLNELNIEQDKLLWTNHAIVKYCVERNEKTLARFVELFMKSKIMKGKTIDLEKLSEKAKKQAENYLKTLSDIEETGYSDFGYDK